MLDKPLLVIRDFVHSTTRRKKFAKQYGRNLMPAITGHDPALLRDATLAHLPGIIARPNYDRRRTVPGLVHIGAGAFNRSHLAVYLDDLLARGEETRWGEFGVGLLPWDREIHEGLKEQDNLYSLLALEAGVESLRVVGSLAGHLYAPEASEA